MTRSHARRSLVHVAILAVGLLAAASSPTAAQAPGDTASVDDSAPPSGRTGTVHGRVLSTQGRRPVEGASVVVRNGRGAMLGGATTDQRGRYRIRGLPAGRLVLDVRTPDHLPHHVDLHVPAAADLRMDVVLKLAPPRLPALLAVAPSDGPIPGDDRDGDGRSDSGRPADPDLRSLQGGPGAGSIAGALAARPDPPGSDPEGTLYVRGGASDLKRVYLDGAPVYTPFHLGGLMDALPSGVLRSARLYTGGAPLARDGGLSSVLDLRTRPGRGDGPLLAGHADLMGVSLRSEGGGPRAAYHVSGRRAHADAAGWLAGSELPYRYHDLLGRADLYLGDGHRASVTGFANRESVRLGQVGAEAAADEATSWGNRAASLRYELETGRTRVLATAATSLFSTRIPVSRDPLRRARSRTRHTRLAVDASTDLGGPDLSYGLDFDDRSLDIEIPPGAEDPGVRWRGTGGSLAAYAAATVRPHPDLSLRGGLRGYAFGDTAGFRVSPRVAVTWEAAESTSLELSAGRFHQRLSAPESVLSSDLSTWSEALERSAASGERVDRGEFPGLSVASASHTTVRLTHRPRDELALGLEGHFKTFDGLARGDDLHASGADLWVEWSSDRWRAGGGYSLGWAWSDAPPDSGVAAFSGRQLLSARVEAPLPSGLRLAAKLRASSGLPFTRIPLAPADPQGGPAAGEPPPSEAGPRLAGSPDGSYLRLDLSLSRTWTADLLGREATLRPYVQVVNALDQRDALFYHFDPAGTVRPRALDTMPVLPVVGLEWEVR